MKTTEFFEAKITFSIFCKNQNGKFLALRNEAKKALCLFHESAPMPSFLPLGCERVASLKLGIPIKLMGILRFEYNIEKAKLAQMINIIYYSETDTQLMDFKHLRKDVFEGEEAVWASKDEILKTGDEKFRFWLDFLEKGGKICPLSMLDKE